MQAGSAGAALVQKCPVNFKLASANKGFEGAHVFKGKDGGRYLLGLCEGGRAAALGWRSARACCGSLNSAQTHQVQEMLLMDGAGFHYCMAQVLRMPHCRTAAAAGNFCSITALLHPALLRCYACCTAALLLLLLQATFAALVRRAGGLATGGWWSQSSTARLQARVVPGTT